MSECSSCGGDVIVFASTVLNGIRVLDAKPTQTAKSSMYYLWKDDDWRMIPARNEKEDAVVKIKHRNRLHVPHAVTCKGLEAHFREIGEEYERVNPEKKKLK